MNYLQKELYELIKSDHSIFSFIQRASLDGIWYWDLLNPENEWMDNKFWETLGYNPKEMPHKASAWQDIINNDDLQIAIDNFNKHCADPNHPYDQVVRYHHKNGSTVWVRCRGMAIRDSSGRPVRMLGAHNEITSLKHKEKLLEESNKLARIGHWELDLVKNKLHWSSVTRELHEVSSDYEPNINTALSFYRKGKSRDTITSLIKDAINHGLAYEHELELHTQKGNQLWVIAKGQPELKDGRCQRIYGTLQDITQRKQAEDELAESNKRNSIFVTQSPNALAMFDTEMRYIAASQQWMNEYGLVGQDIVGKSHYEIFPEIDESWKKIHRECLRGATNKTDEAYFKRDDGSEQWLAWDVRPWYVTEDRIGGLLMYTRDITARKKVEQQLLISEEQFRGAFEYSAIGMALVAPDGKWLKVNKRLCEILGYSENALLTKTFQDITHPDDLNADLIQLKQMLTGEIESYKMEKRYFHKTGQIVWVLLSVSLVKDIHGNPLHFVSQIEDITEKKASEEKLKQVNDRLLLATKAAKMGIWDYDIINNELIWDDQMLELYGIKKEKFSGAYESWLDRLYPDDFKRTDEYVKLAIAGKREFNTEFRIRWPDNTIRNIRGLALVQRDNNGNAVRMVGTNWDITEQKKSEEALRKMATLESKSKEMEQFAYITSHDLREPLLTIKHYAELLLDEYAENMDDEASMFTKSVYNGANRMEKLIQGLLDYSRLSKPKSLKKVNVSEVLDEVKSDLNSLIVNTRASINSTNLPIILAYPLELKLLFQNLIQNAVKFRKENSKPNIEVKSKKLEGGWQFSITDNGIGIDDRDKERVFVMFRKAHRNNQYEGTGIGLALAKKIVETHHGDIWLESTVGEGSTFHFTVLTDGYEHKE
ncbi:PAS domain S-box protein [Fulvivirga ulvae]|uniref:PAS domain S-box protein n=1 Tax=Fulvivirga ulvae TaxID=2904245 RepID=UPI001F2C90BE|nr:PAS domain S-box protein [Fulvivirga ulvae]UII32875.1 PAS domain S-box protein [Fulvivirga ulvae]